MLCKTYDRMERSRRLSPDRQQDLTTITLLPVTGSNDGCGTAYFGSRLRLLLQARAQQRERHIQVTRHIAEGAFLRTSYLTGSSFALAEQLDGHRDADNFVGLPATAKIHRLQ